MLGRLGIRVKKRRGKGMKGIWNGGDLKEEK